MKDQRLSVDTKKTRRDYLEVVRLGKTRKVINGEILDDEDDDESLESCEEPSVMVMLNYSQSALSCSS